MTAQHVCTGKPDPASTRQRREERESLRREIWPALASPGTAAEIRNRMGTHLWRMTVYYGAECRGHLDDAVYCTLRIQGDVQRELVRLEKLGLVARVIMPGVQAHLWYAR